MLKYLAIEQLIMAADYWLKSGKREELPGSLRKFVGRALYGYTPSQLIDVCSYNMQHTFMKDVNNVDPGILNDKGRPTSVKYFKNRHDKCITLEEHLDLLPTDMGGVWGMLEDGEGAVQEYHRPGTKRGLYLGDDLKTFEKAPAQCMLICMLAAGVMKAKGIPARLRVGFIKGEDDKPSYEHHSELQYFDKDGLHLEDPTNYQKKKLNEGTDDIGFCRITELEGRLAEPRFIYATEAAKLVMEAKDDGERKELLGRFFKKKDKGDENAVYDRLSRAMLDDFFALRNDAVVQMALEKDGYWYRGRKLSADKNARERFELIYDELKDISTPEPDSDTIMKKSDIAHYTLKPGKI